MDAKVCVLMPVYNAEDTLAEVLNSILRQTYTDYKLLIVDDGSTDNSAKILNTFSDPRIQVMRFHKKIGTVHALNWSLSEISEPYIIRADARVISLPQRFDKLVTFMDNNPQIGVCGSMSSGYKAGNKIQKPLPLQHEEIVAQMLFENPLLRGSMIIRTSILQEEGFRLRDKYKHMEDYDLWYRMRNSTRFANIHEPLVHSLAKENNEKDKKWQKEYREAAVSSYLEKLLDFGIQPTDKEMKLHLALTNPERQKKISNPLYYKYWLEKLSQHNENVQAFPVSQLKTFLNYKWNELFSTVLRFSNKKIAQYLYLEKKTRWQVIKFIILHRIKNFFQMSF